MNMITSTNGARIRSALNLSLLAAVMLAGTRCVAAMDELLEHVPSGASPVAAAEFSDLDDVADGRKYGQEKISEPSLTTLDNLWASESRRSVRPNVTDTSESSSEDEKNPSLPIAGGATKRPSQTEEKSDRCRWCHGSGRTKDNVGSDLIPIYPYCNGCLGSGTSPPPQRFDLDAIKMFRTGRIMRFIFPDGIVVSRSLDLEKKEQDPGHGEQLLWGTDETPIIDAGDAAETFAHFWNEGEAAKQAKIDARRIAKYARDWKIRAAIDVERLKLKDPTAFKLLLADCAAGQRKYGSLSAEIKAAGWSPI